VKLTSRPTRVFRLLRLTSHISIGLVVASLIYPRVSPVRQDRILRWWGRGVLSALRIEARVNGPVPPLEAREHMLVANHVSWLDVFAIHAVKPVRFVAKADIRNWPVLGWLTARTGTLFIERERRRHALQVIHRMRAYMARGLNLGIFPEGTSSPGHYMRGFHAALFESVRESARESVRGSQPGFARGDARADVRVVPVAIRYLDAELRFTQAAAYADNVTFVQCLRNILRQPSLAVELNFEEALDVSGRSRQELAQAAEASIARRLGVAVHPRWTDPADPPA
jgi:1-acyl-sn-glycerol-3-phosphate acyltransferase